MKNLEIRILFLLLCLNGTLLSQSFEFGATGNIGLSKIATNFSLGENFKVKYSLSGNIGMYAEKRISEISSLGMEILWTQIKGLEESQDRIVNYYFEDGTQQTGVLSDKASLRATYIAIPIYYKVGIGKIGLKGGIQTMMFLFGRSEIVTEGIIDGEPYYYEGSNEVENLRIIELGPKIGIDYELNNQFKLRLDYYHGLKNILDGGDSTYRLNRQITLGVNFKIG